ncbi:MAG: L-erythro-3,5-diaminohexanoate dehydrogenase [Actinobacteria bacterium]|nr:L-erythro-3,5-diaminohexanoate dehydrogenase [Actinomycetota bacterium]
MQHYGTHRVVEPRGVLPQQASILDPHLPLLADEIAIEVDLLNIDSASWRQMKDACRSDAARMSDHIMALVKEHGKMHNPVTGSGGMLIGTVSEVGAERDDVAVGTRIATLVSLTLTPLVLDEVVHLDPKSEKLQVKGRAVLFGSGIYAPVPTDMTDESVLGILDVCGAPAWVSKLATPGMKVVVIGAGGKSGMLTCAQASRSVGAEGRVIGLCWPESTVDAAVDAGAQAVAVDCTSPLEVAEVVDEVLDGERADLVVVCSNVPGCEGGAILSCKHEGRVLFFSMATSFSAAALTAEGLGSSCEMTIGNGYLPGHAQLALDLVRSDPKLMGRFS